MRSRFGLDTVAAAAAALLALALFPRPAAADHSVNQSCYTCHKLSSASIYKGTRAIDKTKAIGYDPAATVTEPLTCDFCHTGYASLFNAGAMSNHPVKHINESAIFVNAGGSYVAVPPGNPDANYAGVKLMCADCHGGNTLTGGPNPDVAPLSKNNTADGYPNHHINGSANGSVTAFKPAWDSTPNPGDMPHTTYAYNHVASTNPAADYALCFSCHDGSTRTTNHVNVSLQYSTPGGGHYFKSGNNDVRIACSDCHATHGSTVSVKLYNRGTIASDPNKRLICLNCHTGAGRSFTTVGGGTTTITVTAPPTTGPGAVAAHETSSTSACTLCHDPHNPSGNRTACYDCHSTNTAIKAAVGASFTKYVDDGATGGKDDFGYSGTASKHNVTFTNVASAHCLDCHVVAAGTHANGSTHDDLKYNGPNQKDWPVTTSITETGNSFASGIEFCLGCHRGGTIKWGQTAPNVNTFIDFGPDGKSSTSGDNVTNNYGHADTDAPVNGYDGNDPPMYDAATGAGHDPPSVPTYTGVPMFAHYTQGATDNNTPKWWQLPHNSPAPQPLPCMDCHYAHGAPNQVLYRSPQDTQALNKGSRALCLDCHDSGVTVEGREPVDPTTAVPNDRYANPIGAHNSASINVSCSSTLNECHHPHTPSCEVCHSYPP